jgi:hypothetical protein
MKKTIDPRKYCQSCCKFLGGRCDILGVVGQREIDRCHQSGYKEIKWSYGNDIRWYHNKTGAL